MGPSNQGNLGGGLHHSKAKVLNIEPQPMAGSLTFSAVRESEQIALSRRGHPGNTVLRASTALNRATFVKY